MLQSFSKALYNLLMTLNCHQLECFLRIGFNENDLKMTLNVTLLPSAIRFLVGAPRVVTNCKR